MNSSCDIAIIGGGVIGLSCAWRLAQAGAKVHLFERGKIGKEASWAAAGMLAAQVEAAVHPPQNVEAREAFFDLCLQSRAMYPSFAAELLEATRTNVDLSLREYWRSDWRKPGILFVGEENDTAFDELEKQRARNLSIEDAPNFSERRAVWLADEGQVNNRSLIIALRRAVERVGVKIHEGKEVEPCDPSQEDSKRCITHIRRGQELIACEKVLICSGASSISSRHDYWSRIPVRAMTGEMLVVKMIYARLGDGDKRIKQIVYSPSIYLVPRRNNELLIGATMKYPDLYSARVSAGGALQLLRAACALAPQIEQWPIVDKWVGHRPFTPDGLPILGCTNVENLFVATGHFRNGILLAPITAQLMTDCILNEVAPPAEFSLQRFTKGVLA